MPKFQTPNQRAPIDRTRHVWVRRQNGRWLCVLCGALNRVPTDEGPPEDVVELTDKDRALCPPEGRR